MSRLVSKSNLSRNAVLFLALLFSLSSPIVSYALAEDLQAENALAISKVETVLQLDDADKLNIETPIIGSDDSITTDGSEYEKRTPEEQSVSLGNVGDTHSMPLELSEAICSGEWGECSWSIDNNGLLSIWPTDGISGRLDDSSYWSEDGGTLFPWNEHAASVRRVDVGEGVLLPYDATGMFSGCSSLSTLDVSGWDTSEVWDMSSMFSGCSSLSTLDVSGWDTSEVWDMSSMFSGCSSLSTLDVSGWDTKNVCFLSEMFMDCSSLSSIDVSRWNTSNAILFDSIFKGCSSLSSIDVSHWDTANATTLKSIFSGCSSLKTIDVANWNTLYVDDMTSAFAECSSLVNIDLSKWNMSRVYNISHMFNSCSSIKTLDLSQWDVSSVGYMEYVFFGCKSLSSLDISGWNIPTDTVMYMMYYDCPSLYSITIGSHYDTSRDFPKAPNGKKWYSVADSKRYSNDEISSRRRFIADTYLIDEWNITVASISNIEDQIYIGEALRPSPIVKLGSRKLNLGIDYTVNYTNNINVGIATVTVIGKGKYNGRKSINFAIKKANIERAFITKISNHFYDGMGIEPDVYIIQTGRMLTENVDYTVCYLNNTAIGTAHVIITGKGNYTGSINTTFEIVDSSTTEIVYRLYNTKTSEHLWTTSENEYRQLPIITKGDWRQEGIAWNAPDGMGFPVYRLYNKKMGDHYYSMDTNEVRILTSKYGWNVDNNGNPAFWSAAESDEGASPLFCVYNKKLKKGQHHFTRSTVERDFLVANAGWRYEKEAFYGYAEEKTITK